MKNSSPNWIISPGFEVKIKSLWNHHLVLVSICQISWDICMKLKVVVFLANSWRLTYKHLLLMKEFVLDGSFLCRGKRGSVLVLNSVLVSKVSFAKWSEIFLESRDSPEARCVEYLIRDHWRIKIYYYEILRYIIAIIEITYQKCIAS